MALPGPVFAADEYLQEIELHMQSLLEKVAGIDARLVKIHKTLKKIAGEKDVEPIAENLEV